MPNIISCVWSLTSNRSTRSCPCLNSLLRVFEKSNYEPGALGIDGLKRAVVLRENTPFSDFLGDVRTECRGPGSGMLKAYLVAKGYLGAHLGLVCFSIFCQ